MREPNCASRTSKPAHILREVLLHLAQQQEFQADPEENGSILPCGRDSAPFMVVGNACYGAIVMNLETNLMIHMHSINEEELDALSKFKHSSGANLNVEGRKLKQAAMAALKRLAPQRETTAMWKARNRADESVRSLNASISLPVLGSVMQDQDEHEHSAQQGLEHDVLEAQLALQTPPEPNQPQEGAEV